MYLQVVPQAIRVGPPPHCLVVVVVLVLVQLAPEEAAKEVKRHALGNSTPEGVLLLKWDRRILKNTTCESTPLLPTTPHTPGAEGGRY
jgi:hypothetical protein